jgi:hypothetical protein
MTYAFYFERDKARSHLSLTEWRAAVTATPGVRLVSAPQEGLYDWIDYWVNPSGSSGQQFHDQPDRAEDAEVLFPVNGTWRRAFYWHQRPEPGLGVVSFEACPSSVPQAEYPVWIAAQALATLLGAELVGQDDTAYEE